MSSSSKIIKQLGSARVLIVSILIIVGSWNLMQTDLPQVEPEALVGVPDHRTYLSLVKMNYGATKYAFTTSNVIDSGNITIVNLENSSTVILRHSQVVNFTNSTIPVNTNMHLIEWSHNNKYIAAAQMSNFIAIWDVSTVNPTVIQAMDGLFNPNNGITYYDLTWSPDSTQVAVSLYNSTVIIWDVISGSINSYYFDSEKTIKVSWSPDGQQLSVVNGTNSEFNLVIIDLGSNEYRIMDTILLGWTTSIRWSNNGKIMLGDKEKNVKIWSIESGKLDNHIKLQQSIANVFFLNSGKLLVGLIGIDYFFIRNLQSIIISQNTGRTLTTYEGNSIYHDSINSDIYLVIAESRDGPFYVSKVNYSGVQHNYDVYRFKEITGTIIFALAIGLTIFSIYGRHHRRFS